AQLEKPVCVTVFSFSVPTWSASTSLRLPVLVGVFTLDHPVWSTSARLAFPACNKELLLVCPVCVMVAALLFPFCVDTSTLPCAQARLKVMSANAPVNLFFMSFVFFGLQYKSNCNSKHPAH